MSEELLVRHCSPTLAGLKTGNMFTVPYTSHNSIKENIRNLNKIMVPKGLCVIPLRFSNNRVLIYLYRPDKLKQDLTDSYACKLLKKHGYTSAKPNQCIVRLIERFSETSEFPHEIGLFLGYPPEDVEGFIDNKADNYKFTGVWKVYGDEVKAKEIFAKFKKCTEVYYSQWLNGITVEKLIVTV
ncbi:MAG: DUF3793 family protein [Acutalibacteraceae bacterium]|nr:DUF3793 family protein [Acutalibacteraceae bacterium]